MTRQVRVKASQTRRALLLAAFVAGQAAAQAPVTYAELAPVLAQRCTMCHGGAAAAAGLRLDSLSALLAGSARGPVVKAGDAAGSELIRRLKGTSQPRMPMTGPPWLGENEIARFERWIEGGLAAGAPVAAAASAAAPRLPAAGEAVTYAHVAPILAQRCAKCHAERGQMGPAPEGYRLTSYEATLAAQDRARIVPGHPAASELIRRVRGQALPRMPLDGPPYLDDAEIRLLEAWVAQGARDSEGRPAPLPFGAAVRLHGTLAAGWRLDDLALTVTPASRIDKRPTPGTAVEVRGRVDEAGRIIVERLRPR